MATATQAILLAQGVPAAAVGASSSTTTSSKLTQLAPGSSSSSLYGSLAGLRAQQTSVRGVSCSSSARAAAVSLEPPVPKQQKKSQYDITTFTTWLLKQEQAGVIDGELTIVLSSISLACKQIASLVQRAGISNMTGLQGAANIQGEDQKKLDVISNEVRIS
jgi:fructose-1,6-bisphosphatase I